MVWTVGALVLVAAGFWTAYAPRRRTAGLRVREAWSSARAAIDSAGVSRDACPVDVPAAEELLHRAELVAAAGGGPGAADEAESCARRADRLWREAAGE
ncbi:DUF6403 family protein [Actinokineospora guangxiensis]|uniref:DUF6403 family protein n=1 Tax=Actinokineospora guangxiensis TaxID=1490288 RepID=A0ABW0EHZ3_9PSEU